MIYSTYVPMAMQYKYSKSMQYKYSKSMQYKIPNSFLIQHSVPVVDIPPLNFDLFLPFVLTLAHHVYHAPGPLPPVAVGPHGGVIVQIILILIVISVWMVGGCGPPSHPPP